MGAKKKARSRHNQAVRDATCTMERKSSFVNNKGNNSNNSGSGGSGGGTNNNNKENKKKAHLYQPGDDLGRFLIHIHTCKKQNSKRLDKFMPALFRSLEEGKYTAEQLVKDFMDIYDNNYPSIGEPERIAIRGKFRLATK